MKPFYEHEHAAFFDYDEECQEFVRCITDLSIDKHLCDSIEVETDDGSMGAKSGKYITLQKDGFYADPYDFYLVWQSACKNPYRAEMLQEISRYREALEWYSTVGFFKAKLEMKHPFREVAEEHEIQVDFSERARKALAEPKGSV